MSENFPEDIPDQAKLDAIGKEFDELVQEHESSYAKWETDYAYLTLTLERLIKRMDMDVREIMSDEVTVMAAALIEMSKGENPTGTERIDVQFATRVSLALAWRMSYLGVRLLQRWRDPTSNDDDQIMI